MLVRNNGIHDALASGVLRIYSAGLLIFTTELYSATIPPGESRDALGTDYWTPPAEGNYLVIADLTCPLDQVEANNHLGPTTILVTGLPPPPPTPVAPHASQHEDGGADEVIVDGLHGRLAEPQTPLDHKDSHQAGGGDQLDVSGLQGILAQGQPIADHHASHENGGGDELSVEGLGGVLVNLQPPQVHDNAKHDPNYAAIPHNNAAHDPDYATESALQAHLDDTSNVHPNAANLEQTANKGEPYGYAGLDNVGYVPDDQLAEVSTPPPDAGDALTFGSGWSRANPLPHVDTHEHDGADELSVEGLHGILGDSQPVAQHATTHEGGGSDIVHGFSRTAGLVQFDQTSREVTLIEATAPRDAVGQYLHLTAGAMLNCNQAAAPATWTFRLRINTVAVVDVTYVMNVAHVWVAQLAARIIGVDATHYRAFIQLLGDDSTALALNRTGHNLNAILAPTVNFTVSLTAELTSDVINLSESRAAFVCLPAGLQYGI